MPKGQLIGTDTSTLFNETPGNKVLLKTIVGELSKKLNLSSCVKILGLTYCAGIPLLISRAPNSEAIDMFAYVINKKIS